MSQGFFSFFLKKLYALALVSIKHVSMKYTMTAYLIRTPTSIIQTLSHVLLASTLKEI